MTRRHALGLDLGPAGAFTALAVVERADDEALDAEPAYGVRHLRRFPPGTPYRGIAKVVGEVLATEELGGSPVAVDVTAGGTGVLDLLRGPGARPRWW